MRLWILLRRDLAGAGQLRAAIVRSATERGARIIAAQHAGDEGRQHWLTGADTTCDALLGQAPAGPVYLHHMPAARVQAPAGGGA